MNKVNIFLWLSCLLFIACKPQDEHVNFTLTDEQLSHLMFDVQLGEVVVAEQDDPARRDSLRTLLWSRMAEVYKLPENKLKTEIRNLESDPEKMLKILDRVQVLSDSIR